MRARTAYVDKPTGTGDPSCQHHSWPLRQKQASFKGGWRGQRDSALTEGLPGRAQMALEATSSSLACPLCRRTGLGWGTPGSPTDKHSGRLTGLPHCMTPTRLTPRGHQAPKGTRASKSCTSAAPQTHTQCTLTETWDQGGLLCLLHLKRGPPCKTKYELRILPPTSKLSRRVGGGSRINPLNCSTNFPRGGPTAFLLWPLPSRCLPL